MRIEQKKPPWYDEIFTVDRYVKGRRSQLGKSLYSRYREIEIHIAIRQEE